MRSFFHFDVFLLVVHRCEKTPPARWPAPKEGEAVRRQFFFFGRGLLKWLVALAFVFRAGEKIPTIHINSELF